MNSVDFMKMNSSRKNSKISCPKLITQILPKDYNLHGNSEVATFPLNLLIKTGTTSFHLLISAM